MCGRDLGDGHALHVDRRGAGAAQRRGFSGDVVDHARGAEQPALRQRGMPGERRPQLQPPGLGRGVGGARSRDHFAGQQDRAGPQRRFEAAGEPRACQRRGAGREHAAGGGGGGGGTDAAHDEQATVRQPAHGAAGPFSNREGARLGGERGHDPDDAQGPLPGRVRLRYAASAQRGK